MKKLAALVATVALVTLLGPVEALAQAETKTKAAQPIQNTKRFAQHTGLFRASTLIDSRVKDASGKDAGRIEDLMVDSRGDIAYAVVSFGGFMGIGDKLVVVPWSAMRVDRERKTVFLDVKKETLERAHGFPEDKRPAIELPDLHDGDGVREARKGSSGTSVTQR